MSWKAIGVYMNKDENEKLIQMLVDKYNYDRDEIEIMKFTMIKLNVDIPSFVIGWQACKAMAKNMPEDFKRVLNLME